jgi:hypothetical protein
MKITKWNSFGGFKGAKRKEGKSTHLQLLTSTKKRLHL